MQNVYKQAESPITAASWIAVVLGEPGDNQRHTGLLFRPDDDAPQEFLHLAHHCDLRRSPRVNPSYIWIEPQINHHRLRQVAAICDQVASANAHRGIPYSFGEARNAFDPKTKKFLLGPTNSGLTCATFVLAVFEAASLRLMRYPRRVQADQLDIEWQRSVVELLKEERDKNPHLVSQEHIDCVTSEVGNSTRYRPEQVAAAAALRKRRPVSFFTAKTLAQDILSYLRGGPRNSTPPESTISRVLRNFGFYFWRP